MQVSITAEAVLHERHVAYVRRQRLIQQATVPSRVIAADWPLFWEHVNHVLKDCGYAQSTRLQFRHVLRSLRQAGVRRPSNVSPTAVRRFVQDLARSEASRSWMALHIGVLRTVFDRLCGKSVTTGLVTPKRGQRLPEILSEREAEQLVQAARTIRDQLLLGLLYGCGLTGSEAVNLRWQDVLDGGARLHIARSTRYMERVLAIPAPFQELLRTGAATCESDDYIFRGRSEGSHLSARMVEIIVRRTCERAGIAKPVCVMTLRHSYAINRLENGVGRRQLQEELGHASIRTTERYRHCLAPELENHPISRIRTLMKRYAADPDRFAAPPPQAKPVRTSRPLASLKAIDLRSLSLPLPRDNTPSPATAFLRLLKTPLLSGILRRRSRSP